MKPLVNSYKYLQCIFNVTLELNVDVKNTIIYSVLFGKKNIPICVAHTKNVTLCIRTRK